MRSSGLSLCTRPRSGHARVLCRITRHQSRSLRVVCIAWVELHRVGDGGGQLLEALGVGIRSGQGCL